MIYIGIDPGVSGGIAILRGDGSAVRVVKMPATEADVFRVVVDWELFDTHVTAVIERVSASPQMGVVSAFTFGKGYGGLTMALTAARIPFDLVSPIKWQSVMGCRSGGDKNITKRRAQQLFPSLTVTHAIADAVLLAEYCRRTQGTYGHKEGHAAPQAGEEVEGDQRQTQRRGVTARHTQAEAPGVRAVAGDGRLQGSRPVEAREGRRR